MFPFQHLSFSQSLVAMNEKYLYISLSECVLLCISQYSMRYTLYNINFNDISLFLFSHNIAEIESFMQVFFFSSSLHSP